MAKSPLQVRAEQAALLFSASARKPIVIEFAGVPKAGKTTTLTALQAFLRRCGFRVEVVVERASVCPVRDKKHANFNVWTACTTLAQILEKTQDPPRVDDPHVLILDRGLFDSICWLEMMEKLSRLRRDDRERIEAFLRIEDWRTRLTAVVLMLATPGDSMEREKGYPPVEGAQGSIMNIPVLAKILATTLQTADRLQDEFRIIRVNTSEGEMQGNARRAAEFVVDTVVTLIEDQLQEHILTLPRPAVNEVFGDDTTIKEDRASKLVDLFTRQGKFLPRAGVEESVDLVQALPVVVVRNRSGDVLRLRRRESAEDNALHKQIVIWAGGHVRREDAVGGSPIVQCAVRELHEELRLDIDRSKLRLLGAVHSKLATRTSRHASLVYEWRAETDDIAVTLTTAEFFERRGTSLSGSFVRREELANDLGTGKAGEPWSAEIVRHLLDPGAYPAEPTLFDSRSS